MAGTAEAIPLPAASVDAVFVGQAWHWFDTGRALPELARVLRPGGVLAALWNAEDTAVEWVAGLHRASERGRPTPGIPAHGIPSVFAEHPAFGPAARRRSRTRSGPRPRPWWPRSAPIPGR